ncbi:MAG TPA: histidine kinase N-terminal 7TM domain-containing protein [Chloroflexota bacterium]|nr:histidine kinase N-terminal 7TM domain-containing protein [Chloroflexota bacterium]
MTLEPVVWQHTPYTVLLMVAAGVAMLRAWQIWQSPMSGARLLAMILLFAGLWSFGYGLEMASANLAYKQLWVKARYIGITAVPTFWALFTLKYTGRNRWLSPRPLGLLLLVPIATLLITFTDSWHSLMFARYDMIYVSGLAVLELVHGPWFVLWTAYAYGLLLLGTLLLLELMVRSRQLYHWQSSLLISAAAVPWAVNVITVSDSARDAGLDFSCLVVIATAMIVSWGLVRLRLDDLVPVARRNFFANTADAVLLLDGQGRILDVNPRAEQLIGTNARAVIGKSVGQVWPQWPQRMERLQEQSSSSEELTVGEGDQQRIYDVLESPVVDWRGRVACWTVVLRDITRRRNAEDALRVSEAKLLSILDSSPDAITVCDLDGTTIDCNQSALKMIGLESKTQLLGANILDSVPLRERGRAGESMGQLLTEGVLRDLEFAIVTVDGREFPGELSARIIEDDSGRATAFVVVTRDISLRKQMSDQLLRAQRLESAGRIAGQVAHDFNNLLSPLFAYPELIKKQLPEGHPALLCCDQMLEAAERMAYINEELLTLGRRGNFVLEPTDLNSLVEIAVAEMGVRPNGLWVRTKLEPELRPVMASSAQLIRVISNLLSNAREAMPNGGELTVAIKSVQLPAPLSPNARVKLEDYVRLSVTDTGCGIPPEIVDKIFDAFFSTKRSVKRRGCGLGLSVVQSIVEDHHGYLDLQSEVGVGTTFHVYLPASDEAPKTRPTEVAKGGKETILVVDDDQLQRDVSAAMLNELGYRVAVASSGEEALEYLKGSTVDLLLLDMMMPPGMDGADTYRRAREIRPGLKAVIVSGFVATERVREAQSLGAGQFLRKPLTLEKLAEAVRVELDCRDQPLASN